MRGLFEAPPAPRGSKGRSGFVTGVFPLLLLSLLLFSLLPALPTEAGAALYKGNTLLGQIPVMKGESGPRLSVADAGALLGLNASVVGEELVLVRGRDQLRLVVNATAAWHNRQLIPLYSSSRVQDGRWWLDVSSLLSLLQRVAGRGGGDKLSVRETPDTAAAAASAPSQTGRAARELPSPSRAPEPKPQPKQSEVSARASGTQSPRVQESRVQEPRIQEPRTQTPPPAGKFLSNGAPSGISFGSSSGIFSAAGELRALRWSISKEKIRAVAECSDGTNPEIKAVSGKAALNFARAADGLSGLPSPYENVRAELTRNADGSATLIFSGGGVRLEKLVLDNPRRIVLDFIFTAPTEIRQAQAQVQAQVSAKKTPSGAVSAAAVPRKKGRRLVVLDPGHGGKDPGAAGNGAQEKAINLAVALKLEKALKAKGFDVRMTRNTDVYLKLQERTDIANNADADMFVSVHVNALPPGKNSAGFEIYLMALPTDKDALALAKIENREYLEDRPESAASDRKTELLLRILGDMQQNNKISESTAAAEKLFAEGSKSGLPMKRVAQAPFFVLRGAGMPAVLLEMGFITNPREAKLLVHPAYQQKIADAMANGIRSYLAP
ncbi:MAG: N-acetylmuramoyl-L-alanine amidase [Synergistaceae bacterium]|jgi:N-acetylmuramoyl-L-alanine amidase|nr:N-acetylmuramoyl-L-alanine amidase [Synergistaceae bacterium]